MTEDRSAHARQIAFTDGHLLDVATLEAMQQLQLEEQRRHLVYQHGAGVIDGMTLTWISDRRELQVSPGLASDGDGHLLRLTETRRIAIDDLAGNLDIWAFRKGVIGDASDRRSEHLEIVAVPYSMGTEDDPSAPSTKAALSIPRSAVRLCRLIASDDNNPIVLPSDRWNDGTLAARIAAPACEHRIQLNDDTPGFTISTYDSAAGHVIALSKEHGLSVGGDVTVEHGHDLFCRDLEFTPSREKAAAEISGANHAMSIGLRSMTSDGDPEGGADASSEDELPAATRFCWSIAEPASPKTDPPNRIRIGRRGSNGVFESIVTIQSDGRTVIDGDLHHPESIVEGPIDADVGDRRFLTLLRRAWRRRGRPDDRQADGHSDAGEVTVP